MFIPKIVIAMLVTLIACGVGFATVGAFTRADDSAEPVASIELRKPDDGVAVDVEDDDDTRGGDNTGDGDATVGNDRTGGGDNTGDRGSAGGATT